MAPGREPSVVVHEGGSTCQLCFSVTAGLYKAVIGRGLSE